MVWNGDEVKRQADILAQKSPFEIGLFVEGQAKLLAPVHTVRLRGSIQTVSGTGQRTKPKDSNDTIAQPDEKEETFVGTAVQYAPYMEYGTYRSDAQPFLRPAFDIAKGKVLTIVQRGARREFGEYLNPRGIMTNEESIEAQT
jgi:HK97 gp10 family phage protein